MEIQVQWLKMEFQPDFLKYEPVRGNGKAKYNVLKKIVFFRRSHFLKRNYYVVRASLRLCRQW
jgi:hypothetical protein